MHCAALVRSASARGSLGSALGKEIKIYRIASEGNGLILFVIRA